jgi:hypothetical protein
MSEPADETARPRRRGGAPRQSRAAGAAPEPAADASAAPEPPPAEITVIEETIPPGEPPEAQAAAPPRRPVVEAVVLAAAVVIVAAALAATPFWAPPLMQLLPWGPAVPATPAPPAPRAEAAPDPGLAAARSQAAQNAAALQQLGQRVAALEAKPPPDLAPVEQRLAALGKANADFAKNDSELAAKLAALQKTVQARPAGDANETALALTLLQIREAVDLAHPFDAEYQALVALARDHPEIAAAAQPLAGPAATGVASRTALVERLRQLAPQIATAKPPPKSSWKSQIVARLRGLVTVRRIDGDRQTPAEAAVGKAQQDVASGDLAGAVDALSALSGPSRDAAEPWLQMARQRLAVETGLRRVAAAITAALGKPAPDKG